MLSTKNRDRAYINREFKYYRVVFLRYSVKIRISNKHKYKASGEIKYRDREFLNFLLNKSLLITYRIRIVPYRYHLGHEI